MAGLAIRPALSSAASFLNRTQASSPRLRSRSELGETPGTGNTSAHAAQYAAGAVHSAHCRPTAPKRAGGCNNFRVSITLFAQQHEQVQRRRGFAIAVSGGRMRNRWLARGEAHMAKRSKAPWKSGSNAIPRSSTASSSRRTSA